MQRDTQRDGVADGADASPSTPADAIRDGDAGGPDADADAATGGDGDAAVDVDRRLVDVESDVLGDDPGVGVGAGAGASDHGADEADDGGGLRARLPSLGLGGDVGVSPVSFVAVTVAMLLGLVAGAAVPILGGVPLVGGALRFAGLFAVAFGTGLVGSRRRYAEVGAGAALASGLAFVPAVARPLVRGLASLLGAAPGEVGLLVTGAGVGTGLLVALAGYYFGRDLRAGLTREL